MGNFPFRFLHLKFFGRGGILFLMKSMLLSAVKILVTHFLLLLIGTVVGAVLYMVYSMCSTLVAGQGFANFNLGFFVQGIFLTLPIIFAASAAFIAFYTIRHSEIQFGSVIVFIVVYMLEWIFIQPLIVKVGIQKASKESYVIERDPLSTGYFRNYAGKYIFYFSSVDKENISSGICMDTTGGADNVSTFENVHLPYSNSTFTDSLIQSSIDIPPVTKFAIGAIGRYLGVMTLECSSGFLNWILFSSLGLVLASLLFMNHFSRWRLANVVIIFALTVFMIQINVSMLSFGKLYLLTQKISSMFTFVPEQSNFLMVFINIFFTVLFTAGGISKGTYNRLKAV